MAKFESDSYLIKATKATLESFIGNPANLKEILPSDRIENWKETDNGCSFKIKGLADISLHLESKENGNVIYASASEKPFPFKLLVKMEDSGEEQSELSASFDAEVNAFMATMLKGPLVNFLNSLGNAIKKKYEAI